MAQIIKFVCYLLLLTAALLLHGIFLKDLLLSLSGRPDWFVQINTGVGLLPFSGLFFLLLAVTGLVSLLRLLIQSFQGQPRDRAFGLRVLTVGSAFAALLLILAIMNVRPLAWKSHQQALDKALQSLRPGLTAAQAETRLNALHPAEPDRAQFPEGGGSRHRFVRTYSLGGLDAYESLSLELHYGRDGKLRQWEYRRQVFVDQPRDCQILKAYPAQGTYPRPCPGDERAYESTVHARSV